MSTQEQVDELVEIAHQRANIYRFFSILYSKEPSEDFVKEISKNPLHEILESLGIEFDDIFKKENAAEELGFEYLRVFVGTGPKHVPPYESVFIDKRDVGGKQLEKLMWGPSTEAVAAFYAKLEYEPEEKFQDMPDHLGVELGFMEQLCIEEVESYRSAQNEKAIFLHGKQLEFLQNHLLKWIDAFVDEVQGFSALKFYRSAARITAAFLYSEEEFLQANLSN